MAEMPEIDESKCQGCGLCASVCRCGALVVVGNKATICKKEGCPGCTRWCTVCESVCPNGAISCAFEIIIEEKQRSA